jgi:hypothetical protein
LSEVFERATQAPFKGFEESTDKFAAAVDAFAEATLNADRAKAEAASARAAAPSFLYDPITNALSENVGRTGQLEKRRGPIA